MNRYNTFFHKTSEFSEQQFEQAEKEKKIIRDIYNKFDGQQFENYSLKNEFIVFDFDVSVSSIGETSSPDYLNSYTRKYIPKLQKHTYHSGKHEPPNVISLLLSDTEIVPAYINSQYIGILMQDQFYHIARQCFLFNLVYCFFNNTEEKMKEEIEEKIAEIKRARERNIEEEIAKIREEEIKKVEKIIKVRKEIENSKSKIIVLLNNCNLELKKPTQSIRQGLDSVIDETNKFLEKIVEKNIIVVGYNRNFIDESVLIDQIIENGNFKKNNFIIDKKLKEHFLNDMLLLNNKTILDGEDTYSTTKWTSQYIFPPKMITIDENKCVLKEFDEVEKIEKERIDKNNQQGVIDFSELRTTVSKKMFVYYKTNENDTFYKIEFIIPKVLLNKQLYDDVIYISPKISNESISKSTNNGKM